MKRQCWLFKGRRRAGRKSPNAGTDPSGGPDTDERDAGQTHSCETAADRLTQASTDQLLGLVLVLTGPPARIAAVSILARTAALSVVVGETHLLTVTRAAIKSVIEIGRRVCAIARAAGMPLAAERLVA